MSLLSMWRVAVLRKALEQRAEAHADCVECLRDTAIEVTTLKAEKRKLLEDLRFADEFKEAARAARAARAERDKVRARYINGQDLIQQRDEAIARLQVVLAERDVAIAERDMVSTSAKGRTELRDMCSEQAQSQLRALYPDHPGELNLLLLNAVHELRDLRAWATEVAGVCAERDTARTALNQIRDALAQFRRLEDDDFMTAPCGETAPGPCAGHHSEPDACQDCDRRSASDHCGPQSTMESE